MTLSYQEALKQGTSPSSPRRDTPSQACEKNFSHLQTSDKLLEWRNHLDADMNNDLGLEYIKNPEGIGSLPHFLSFLGGQPPRNYPPYFPLLRSDLPPSSSLHPFCINHQYVQAQSVTYFHSSHGGSEEALPKGVGAK